MATPDVRVRLSAEGVSEVVAALRKVQTEAKAAGNAGAAGVASIAKTGGVLSSVGTALKGFVGAALLAKVTNDIIQLTAASLAAADGLDKTARSFGASAENLSAMAAAAAKADVDVATLEKTVAQLNSKLQDLRAGDPATAAQFRKLGLSAKDFEGKDAVEAIDVIARRVASLVKDGRDADAVMDILGAKLGRQVLPFLNEIGKKGLQGLIGDARITGQLLDAEVLGRVRQLDDALDQVQGQLAGAGLQFLTGVAGPLADVLNAAKDDTGEIASAFRDLGTFVGGVLAVALGACEVAISDSLFLVRQMQAAWEGISKTVSALAHGDLRAAGDAMSESIIKIARLGAEAQQKRRDIGKAMFSTFDRKLPASSDFGGDKELRDREQAVRQRAAAIRAGLDAELALIRTQLRAREESEQRSFDQAQFSAQEFYSARRQLVENATNQEVAVLLKRRALEGSNPDVRQAALDVTKTDAEISQKRIEGRSAILDIYAQELQAVRRLGRERLAIENEVLAMQGRAHEAQLRNLADEVRSRRETLTQAGVPEPERERTLAAFESGRRAEIAMQQAQLAIDRERAALDVQRAEIRSRVQRGLLTELEGESQILALEQGRVPVVQDLLTKLIAAAEATKNPDAILAAQQLRAEYESFGQTLSNTQQAFKSASESGVSDFLTNQINQVRTLDDAWRALGLTIANVFQRVIGEQAAQQITRILFPGKADGGLVKKADGGLIRGPGTGTSDSIPALLSNREFVVPAAAVKRGGNLAVLESMRRGLTIESAIRGMNVRLAPREELRPRDFPRGFAEGGLVESGAAGSAGSFHGVLEVNLPEGASGKVSRADGDKATLQVLVRNRRSVTRILGLRS